MFKKILILSGLLILSFSFLGITYAEAPTINCYGLPGCTDTSIESPGAPNIDDDIGLLYITKIIGQVIQIVAVFAVFALIFSGVLYLTSGGEEEKVNKAKKWIIWSLAGVLLSISAWSIIELLNRLTIG